MQRRYWAINDSWLMQAMEPRYQAEQPPAARLPDGGGDLCGRVDCFALYLRERSQWLFLWLAMYLLADGLIGFRQTGCDELGLHLGTLQIYLQFVGSAQDMSLWLLLLYAFRTER